MAWVLVLYCFLLFIVPWGARPGYEALVELAPKILGDMGSPWVSYTLALAIVFGGLTVASKMAWLVLDRDSKEWRGVRNSSEDLGCLGAVDGALFVAFVGIVAYAAANRVPVHGVLAAVIPALVCLLARKRTRPTGDRPAIGEGEEGDATKPPDPRESLPTDLLITAARRHAGEAALSDTEFRSVVFHPPSPNEPRLADPEPYVVSWVIPRSDRIRAAESAPEKNWTECSDFDLIQTAREASGNPTVALLAELVAGTKVAAVENRVTRLRAFVATHFEPGNAPGRPRTPVTCLVEQRASEDEARVLLLALVLSHLAPDINLDDNARHDLDVSAWRTADSLGLALSGVPGPSDAFPGIEYFAKTGDRDTKRFVLLDAIEPPDRLVPLQVGRPSSPWAEAGHP